MYDAVATQASLTHKFTAKERDPESGLDNFGARYNSSSIGRFMSPDPLLNSGRPWDPQTWNRYAYARNNFLNILDPTGLYNTPDHCNDGDKKCKKQLNKHREELRKAVEKLTEKVEKMKDGQEKARLQASLKALGTAEDGNNVFVKFGATGDGSAATTVATYNADSKETSFNVTLDTNMMDSRDEMAIDAAHEGTHVADISDPRYANSATTLSDFSLEYRGYQTSAWAAQALGFSPLAYENGSNVIWNSSWAAVDRQTHMDRGITQHVTSIPGHPETTPHNPWDN
jgi:RHS repeat-associated protein